MTGERGSWLMANGNGRWAARHQPSAISHVVAAIVLALVVSASTAAAQPLPELTQPVNDFAHVIDF